VLLINQDAVIHEEALKIMIDNCDGLELISPVHLNNDGTRLDNVFYDMLKRSNQDIIQMALMNHEIEVKVEVGMVCAACWLLPIDLIKKIGGFNPIFYHYGEDDNYYHRLVYHGIKTQLITKAYMQHDRKIQGNMKMFNKNRLKRDMLLILTNINWKPRKQCLEMIRLLKKCYTNYLPQKTYFPGLFFYQCIRMIFMANKIARSRKYDKSVGLNWI
jgi:GT2 family glycosyltransferase